MNLENSAERYQQSGHFKKAYTSFLLAYKRSNDPELCLKLGDISRQLENFSEAKTWYKKVSHMTDAQMGLAMTHRGLFEYSKAIAVFKRCARRYKKSKDLEGQAYVLWAMGTTFRFMGKFLDAEKKLRAAIKIYMRLKDLDGLAYARCGLGGTYRMRGLAQESGRLYKEGNEFFKKVGDKFGLAYSHCGQGNALRMQGKYKEGMVNMKKAISLYRALKQKGPLAYVLWSLAQAEVKLGKNPHAKKNLSEAEKIFKQVKDKRGLVYVYLGQGKYRQALASAKKLKLPFETLHARYFLEGEKVCPMYKKLGVSYSNFMEYKTLP